MTKPNNTIYSQFALVYDLMGADDHSRAMIDYTDSIMSKFHIQSTKRSQPMRGLDLCCGTGTAIELLSERGFAMSGLDQSATMLAMAARKLKGKRIPLYQKTLPKFKLRKTGASSRQASFDFITSFYDSLNYMKTEKQLGYAFQAVGDHLVDNGWFIFDMNTPEALKTVWSANVYADARDEIAWIWRNEYHAKTKSATLRTTFFTKKGTSWERFDETHIEFGYSNTVIRKLLKSAGFKIHGLFKCFTFRPADRETYRICVVAQKR